MCVLFGLIDCGHTLSGRQKTRILSALSKECECRGIDAAGIAYNSGGKFRVYKRPGPAHKLRFSIPNDAYVVMGHTRMTTQGNAKHNFNNHPFTGRVNGVSFALAHNGVLFNEYALRRQFKLPSTRIQTDSYAAVQILEQQKALTPAAMKFMAAQVEGTFVFSVLDQADNLTLIRGDNPLCLYHYPRLDVYLYASTELILQSAIRKTILAGERANLVPVAMGELLSINAQGKRTVTQFEPNDPFS